MQHTQKNKTRIKYVFFLIAVLFLTYKQTQPSFAEGLPYVDFVKEASTPTENALAVKQLLILSVFTLIPSIILTLTPFVRFSIILSMLRQSLGLNQTPPNQVLLALALFMSITVMSGVFSEVNDQAIKPYMNNEINIKKAMDNASKPVREYMFKQVGESELSLFINLNKKINNDPIPKTYRDIPNKVLFPAYLVSEIKQGLFIGVIISIIFVCIDLATSAILQAMGMMMLSPMVISGIFKLILFIFAYGFELVIQASMLSIK